MNEATVNHNPESLFDRIYSFFTDWDAPIVIVEARRDSDPMKKTYTFPEDTNSPSSLLPQNQINVCYQQSESLIDFGHKHMFNEETNPTPEKKSGKICCMVDSELLMTFLRFFVFVIMIDLIDFVMSIILFAKIFNSECTVRYIDALDLNSTLLYKLFLVPLITSVVVDLLNAAAFVRLFFKHGKNFVPAAMEYFKLRNPFYHNRFNIFVLISLLKSFIEHLFETYLVIYVVRRVLYEPSLIYLLKIFFSATLALLMPMVYLYTMFTNYNLKKYGYFQTSPWKRRMCGIATSLLVGFLVISPIVWLVKFSALFSMNPQSGSVLPSGTVNVFQFEYFVMDQRCSNGTIANYTMGNYTVFERDRDVLQLSSIDSQGGAMAAPLVNINFPVFVTSLPDVCNINNGSTISCVIRDPKIGVGSLALTTSFYEGYTAYSGVLPCMSVPGPNQQQQNGVPGQSQQQNGGPSPNQQQQNGGPGQSQQIQMNQFTANVTIGLYIFASCVISL